MANIQVEHRSSNLSHLTTFHLILAEKMPPQFTKNNPFYQRPAKTLVLLHGYSGSTTDWLYHTPAAILAMKYNLSIVFPNGDVSFYLDGSATGRSYGKYIGEELPRFLQETFGIAKTPEDTLIGGNSMGGFGAVHTALKYPETYGGAFALSMAMIIHDAAAMTPGTNDPTIMANYDYYVDTFGDLSTLEDSDKNPEVLVRRLKTEGRSIPSLYMACGTEDFLIKQNRAFHKFLVDEGVLVKYEEGSGVHDWDYWNTKFEPALKHLLKCD